MKKSFIIHAVWAVVAVIAFVVGSKHIADDQAEDSADTSARQGGRYSDRSQASGPRSSSLKRSAKRSNRSTSEGGEGYARRTQLSENGIKALGNLIQTSNDPIERRIAFSKLLEGLTSENAMLMREQIVHMSSNSPEWKEFHYAWGGLAGLTAVEFGAESKKMDMAACFSGWVGKDPGAALAWYESQEDKKRNRDDLKWGAVYGLANNDPLLATQFLEQRMQAGDKDVGKMTHLVAAAVLRSGSVSDAARWSQSLSDGPMKDAAVSRVAKDYVYEDPEKATAWLESLPKDSGQARALGIAYSTWAGRDADAVVSKINRLNNSPTRDAAVQGYVTRIGWQDPGKALEWANTINDTKMRDASITRIGRTYMYKDREAATNWLTNSNLSAAIQKRILATKKRK